MPYKQPFWNIRLPRLISERVLGTIDLQAKADDAATELDTASRSGVDQTVFSANEQEESPWTLGRYLPKEIVGRLTVTSPGYVTEDVSAQPYYQRVATDRITFHRAADSLVLETIPFTALPVSKSSFLLDTYILARLPLKSSTSTTWSTWSSWIVLKFEFTKWSTRRSSYITSLVKKVWVFASTFRSLRREIGSSMGMWTQVMQLRSMLKVS